MVKKVVGLTKHCSAAGAGIEPLTLTPVPGDYIIGGEELHDGLGSH